MTQRDDTRNLRTAVGLLRITLGVIILVTWWENYQKGLYTGEGLTGLFNWLFDADDGNGSSLTTYKRFVDATVLRVPTLFAAFQFIAEFLMGVALIVGGLTPLAGGAATFFFSNLFLAYFGGEEWIWVYVLLVMVALVVTITRSGRYTFGLDRYLVEKRGEPPYPFLW